MGAEALERVCGAFEEFHASFAPAFGRRETLEHSRHCKLYWCSPRSGATPRACRRRCRCRREHCSVFSPSRFGTTTRSLDGCRSILVLGWMTLRGCRFWTAATFPSRE